MKKACIEAGGRVWTMTYNQYPDETIEIIDFSPDDNDGYMFRDTLGKLDELVEDANRVVLNASINGEHFRVRNQQNVFSYKQPH